MANCPRCTQEYTPEPDNNFCDNCRFPLTENQGAGPDVGSQEYTVDDADSEKPSAISDSVGNAEPITPGGLPVSEVAGNTKVQAVDADLVVGGNYTVNNTGISTKTAACAVLASPVPKSPAPCATINCRSARRSPAAVTNALQATTTWTPNGKSCVWNAALNGRR